ncbi:MAG: helix-turn-helix transcriptional regulator [Actinobacteria bacterium]|nr:helix-turn-helix transcriptional regulator [Actinomycetota bacterium]
MEGELQRAVGRNIRRVRNERGLSQEQFGEAIGWHRTLVGAVERGERNLTLKSVERVSIQLGVDPRDLFRDPEAAPLRVAAADGAGEPGRAPGSRSRRPRRG